MAEDTMLIDAIEAIRQGKKAEAKSLLTRLIKADQHNATYWVWMSAAVTTQKERVYALQTALRVDPENVSAKRGLVLLGAMPPDESIDPFPLHHPRLWEEELAQVEKEGNKTGFKAFIGRPIVRLAGIGVGVLAILIFAFFGLGGRRNTATRATVNTAGPSPTYTLTPTALNAKPVNTAAIVGPTPLWMLVGAEYTPTPLYVNTPRSMQAADYAHAVEMAYENEDWNMLISSYQQIATLEPENADPLYYIGEAYRFLGENAKALDAYNTAIERDENFGPAYLGKARILPYVGGAESVSKYLDEAVKRDPNFTEAYIDRAIYLLSEKEYEAALDDLEDAEKLSPNSNLVYHYMAKVYQAQDEIDDAIEAAEKAMEINRTHLDTYFLLGELYQQKGNLEKAVEYLEIYILYEEDNGDAYGILGGAYYADEDYEKAIEVLDDALKMNSRSGISYYYRGLSYLALGEAENAVDDLNDANQYMRNSFDINLAIAQAEYQAERFGNCYLQVEKTRPLIETTYQEALVYYWRATCHEGRDDLRSASKDWQALLDMPFSADIAYMRAEAREHLAEIYTPTPTLTPSITPTVPTLTPTGTKGPSPTPSMVPLPTKTPTPTPAG